MATSSIADTKAHLSSWVSRAEAGEPVLITRHGRPVVAMISVDEWERVQALRGVQRRGLVALIGGWEGSDDLAERVEAVAAARTPSRPLPVMG